MSRFWEFSQLSDAYRNHSLLDRVDIDGTDGALFIGGLKAIDQPDVLKQHGITHILSALEYDHCDYEEYASYQRLWLPVEDHPSQDLVKHFSRTNAFIDHALSVKGKALVHCAMGVSRSATIVCAYFMYRCKISFLEALGKLQQSRPLCAPNTGFAEQLELYDRMLKAASDEKKQEMYDMWLAEHQTLSKL